MVPRPHPSSPHPLPQGLSFLVREKELRASTAEVNAIIPTKHGAQCRPRPPTSSSGAGAQHGAGQQPSRELSLIIGLSPHPKEPGED